MLDEEPPDADVILAGDCWYDAGLAERVLPWLQRAQARGIAVLVGDPGRRYLPTDQLVELAAYEVRTTTELEDLDRKRAAVYGLRPAARLGGRDRAVHLTQGAGDDPAGAVGVVAPERLGIHDVFRGGPAVAREEDRVDGAAAVRVERERDAVRPAGVEDVRQRLDAVVAPARPRRPRRGRGRGSRAGGTGPRASASSRATNATASSGAIAGRSGSMPNPVARDVPGQDPGVVAGAVDRARVGRDAVLRRPLRALAERPGEEDRRARSRSPTRASGRRQPARAERDEAQGRQVAQRGDEAGRRDDVVDGQREVAGRRRSGAGGS